ncbi:MULTISPECIES: NtrZ family periplasmic regulatory protein [unclassified Brevundimonas]|uniref:NtrZ family periplasmic regulatory protein n=2 Tax=Brevundimonas TaxID=41275 RepID=UPI000E81C3D8|nr:MULTISPECIES: hypothetical protein [unclassified Brevundimonas]MCK6105733.1 hypothetical protein [Brevundimonas sp. EYE_349]HBI17797.1 hypothetical protein [Brevundimonas sp.]
MRLSGFLAVMMATTAVVGSTSALAQSASGTVSLSEAQAAQRNTPAPQRRGLRLNDRGRWGLDFNLNQPVGRETDWGDVEAGAYYRLNDRLRVGAAAAVATPEADPARAPETNSRAQPRVRLETIFKF